MSMKISNDTIWNRSSDLPICSEVLQPTAPPGAPEFKCSFFYYAISEMHINLSLRNDVWRCACTEMHTKCGSTNLQESVHFGALGVNCSRGQLKCDGTSAETRFRLSAKRTSPYKSAGASVQTTTGSRGVRISGSNAGYTMFRGSVKGTGYPLHSPVPPSLTLPCVTVCHLISTEVYNRKSRSRIPCYWGVVQVFRYLTVTSGGLFSKTYILCFSHKPGTFKSTELLPAS